MSRSMKTLIEALVAFGAIALIAANLTDAGGNKGNKGERDIILYNNNLLIRGNGKGKGKGKGEGEGTLLIAGGGHKDGGHHHEGGHFGYGEHYGFGEGHYAHKEDKFIMDAILGERKMGATARVGRQGRNGGGGGGDARPKSGNKRPTWEMLLLGDQGRGNGFS